MILSILEPFMTLYVSCDLVTCDCDICDHSVSCVTLLICLIFFLFNNLLHGVQWQTVVATS